MARQGGYGFEEGYLSPSKMKDNNKNMVTKEYDVEATSKPKTALDHYKGTLFTNKLVLKIN